LDQSKKPGSLLKPNSALERFETPVIEAVPLVTHGVYDGGLHGQEHPLHYYWSTIVRRIWTILAVTLITTTIAVIATFKMVPEYKAVGRIAIQRESSDLLGFKSNFGQDSSGDDWDYTVALDTQVRVLESEALAMQTIHKLGWDRAASGALASPLKNQDPALSHDNSRRESALISLFLRRLAVEVVPGTRIVELRYMSPDPRHAAEAVNTLINTYIEQNFKTKYETTMRTSEWLQKQLTDLQMKVEASQEKLVRYQRENDILGIDEKQNIVTAKLDELNKNLTDAQTDRIQREAQYRLALSGEPDSFAKLDSNLMSKLEEQKANLDVQYAQLSTQFGPSYPKVVELQNQLRQTEAAIRAEQQKLIRRLEGEYRMAQAREKMLTAALERQKQEANRLNESAIEYMSLKRDAETNRQLYDGLQQRLKEAGIAAGLRSNNVNIVDVARVPTAPSKPNVPLNIAFGLGGGLLAGLGLAFLLDSLDVTIRNGEQVSTLCSLPELGVIPLDLEAAGRSSKQTVRKSLARRTSSPAEDGPALLARPKSQLSESYRALRTSVLLSGAGEPPRVIMITSPLPREGKSTTSVNMAVALAQKGGRVLLVDADMRRPSLHKMIDFRPRAGLSSALSGVDSLEKAIVPFGGMTNLFLLPAGPTPPQPAELLGSPRMREYLACWRQEYDHVVIDTPPCLSVTDAVVLSVLADRVILVVRSGVTTKTALKRAGDLLAHVNAQVLGVVLNAMDMRASRYYYSYYHYYSGKYSGEYYNQEAHE
jgi:succinoglycan biosynthesis transport protein ExoP